MSVYPPDAGLDTARASAAQDVWDTAAIRRGHLRVRTLVTLRWVVIGGEIALLAAMAFALQYPAPYFLCAMVVAAGAFVNVLTGVASPPQRVMGDQEAVAQLALDVLQMALLLGLIGGTANPFILILLAPVTLAAATLPLRPKARSWPPCA